MIKLKTNKKNIKAFTCTSCPVKLKNQLWSVAIKRGIPYLVMGKWIPIKNITKMQYLHRLLLNAKKGQVVDHINGDTLDNRLCNLRICTNQENIRNSKIPKNNTTGYKGICYVPRNSKKPWSARVFNKHLGYFKTKEAAALAYNIAAKKVYGKFARLNVVK